MTIPLLSPLFSGADFSPMLSTVKVSYNMAIPPVLNFTTTDYNKLCHIYSSIQQNSFRLNDNSPIITTFLWCRLFPYALHSESIL